MNKLIFLDPGHSKLRPGATDADGIYNGDDEWDLNCYQAEVLKSELRKLGVTNVVIFDDPGDDKKKIADFARGAYALISLHLNAFNRKVNYSSAKISLNQTTNSLSALVASDFIKSCSEATGIRLYEQKGFPKGIMPGNLEILNRAHRNDIPIKFLSELFFIDFYDLKADMKAIINTAMPAGAKVLKRYFI